MRCAKSKKLYNMATVLLQICNGTDKCCKKFIILYSLFSPLSSFFLFSSLSLSGSLSLRRWSFRDWHVSRIKLRRRFRLLSRAYPPWSTGTTRGWDSASKAEDHRRDWTLRVPATLNQPRSISPISPRGRRRSSSLSSLSAFHPASLWLWVFFFFFYCNLGWSDGGGGLWAIGGDSGSGGGL